MMQLDSLNLLILGRKFQVQKISIVLVIILVVGRAAIQNDNKPGFLRQMAAWLKRWDNSKILNCEKFTLSAQSSLSLQRTLLC